MANRIFVRWIDYIEQKKLRREFQSGIIISAYSNIILYCLKEYLGECNKWEKYFVKWMTLLERDMYEWYESISDMQSTFFLDTTLIYYCLCLKEDKLENISDLKTREHMHKTARIIFMYERFWDKNQLAIMEEIKRKLNIEWTE